MKLLILGIDGATFDLIKPWAKEGHLPNLSKLIEQGTHGELMSTLPPVTSPAWPTFMTGCNPGKHGVFDFIQPSGNGFNLVNASKIKVQTIWQYLSQLGYRVGVLNVPVTYPPQEVNGFLVSGILSPKEGDISHPADLISRYKADLGEYRVAPNIQYKTGNEAEYIEDMYALIHAHGTWALTLAEKEPVDVMMVHFIALDMMMHALWRFMDKTHPRHEASPYEHALRDGYKLVDDYVGKLVAKLDENGTMIAMSDHGFGPLHNIVNLNNFLMQEGFVKLKRDPMTQLKATAFKYGLTPSSVYHSMEKMGVQNVAARVSKDTRNSVLGKFLSFESVDWSKTVAYSMGHVGQIYLNMVGREPNGIVKPEEYKKVRQEIVDSLAKLKNDEGKPLVSKIILREETYHGQYAEDGPDIHLILDDYNVIAYPLFACDGKIVTQQIRGDSGCHRSEGIFIAHGNNIQAGSDIDGANILDLAPTILGILGEPVPQRMDGKALMDIFADPIEITFGEDETDSGNESAFSEEEAKQIEDRLRSLGYL